ncbi:MAG TPA: hypothetical protein VHB69_13935 [Mycobacteriales bacterium]|nr:hypothetical protein [Mycobacteriales bacterium]
MRIGLIAAVALVGLIGGVPPTSAATGTAPASPPSRDALQAAAGTHHVSNIVRVPAGYEAASWTEPNRVDRRGPGRRAVPLGTAGGAITFWKAPNLSGPWRRIGASRYTSVDRICRPTVRAGIVAGGRDAVFLARTCLTGDGSLNDLGYGDGPDGWGVIEMAGARSLVSRGNTERWRVIRGEFEEVPASAVHYLMRFVGGQLQTVDGSYFLSTAESDEFPRETMWRWSGSRLTATSTTAFVARPAAALHREAPALPSGSCPRSGTFSAAFGVVYRPFGRRPRAPNGPLRFEVFPPSNRYPGGARCHQQLPSSSPMSVLLAHSDRPYAQRAALSRQRWMTAPLWFILVGRDGFLGDREPLAVGPAAARQSPYVVPARYRVNVAVARFGVPVPVHSGSSARPTRGTVTFRDGRIVGIAVRP